MSEAACNPCMSVVMVWDCCNALNCANCAANAVSLCGLSGSCEVICVTSNFKKSAWFRLLLPVGVTEEVADIFLGPRFPAGPGGFFGLGFCGGKRFDGAGSGKLHRNLRHLPPGILLRGIGW